MENRTSPLSGQLVAVQRATNSDISYYRDICGTWAIDGLTENTLGGASILGGHLALRERTLSEVETKRTFALARSEVWRNSKLGSRTPCITSQSDIDIVQSAKALPGPLLSLDELERTSRLLTLVYKAGQTLQNLVLAEAETGAGMEIPYLMDTYPGRKTWEDHESPREIGFAHGCTDVEAPVVYSLLSSEGYVHIRGPLSMGDDSHLYITPRGYARADELARGTDRSPRKGFFVCRFIDEIDKLYSDVIHPLAEELGFPIRRIKDIHHIDKIDDRICREIRQATVVIVDLTNQNFNVAFEAGYALALNKPIVWTTKEVNGELKMPFDIYTYNCLQWSPNNLAEFQHNLKYRILAALERPGESH